MQDNYNNNNNNHSSNHNQNNNSNNNNYNSLFFINNTNTNNNNNNNNNKKEDRCSSKLMKIKTSIRKGIDKMMHKPPQHPLSSSHTQSTPQLNQQQQQIKKSSAATPYVQSTSLVEQKSITDAQKEMFKGRTYSLGNPQDLVQLQQHFLENLKKRIDAKQTEVVKFQNEIKKLKHELETRRKPLVADNEIQNLREEIRRLTNKKAELEMNLKKKSRWKCDRCTYENDEEKTACIVCSNERNEGIWICQFCSTRNSLVFQTCSKCNAVFDHDENIGNY